MKPILVQLGPFPISSFGLFLLFAFLVGIAVVRRRGRGVGIDPSQMLDTALYMIIGGIIAGRLGYVVVNFESFAQSPTSILTIWRDAGLTFYGALIGGLIVGAAYARARRLPLRQFVDVFAPALALAYAIAMIGALLHGLFIGRPTSVPWGVQMFLDRRHPTQAYLLVASLGTYLVLRAQGQERAAPGILFFLWLLLHALSRVAVEFFVETPPLWGPLSLAQVVNVVAAVVALAGLVVSGRRPAPEAQVSSPAMPQAAGPTTG